MDLVKEGHNGFTFDPYDAEALAHLLFKLSTLSASRLSSMSNASEKIIANWGSDRFAQGLKAAVEKAIEVGLPSVNLIDRLFLRLLTWAR